MQTWAIIAQKGGQSKTTIATAFAVEAAREGAAIVILDADDRQGSALYWSERRDTDDVMVKDSSVAGLPLHVSRGRDSGRWTSLSSTRRRTRKTLPCSRPSRPISW
jgi:chromosome partitioning protein